MRTLALVLLLAACDSGIAPGENPDLSVSGGADLRSQPDLLAVLPEGADCDNGIGGILGVCAAGLKCCVPPCTVDAGNGCLDTPSQCTSQPPPPGYGFCS